MPYDVITRRLPISALFELKGPRDRLAAWSPRLARLPTQANSLLREDGDTFCHTGPDRWLVRAEIEREAMLQAALRPEAAPPEISIVRVSDTLTFFRLTGPDADEVMAIGCPMDLHPTVFGEEAVSFTEFFGLRALVMRSDQGFDCAVEQSFGDMIEDYLARALA